MKQVILLNMLPVATLLWPLLVFGVSYHKSDGYFLAEHYVGKAHL